MTNRIKVGTRIVVETSARRTDGLLDVQIFEAVVTAVDSHNAHYTRTKTVREENVLLAVTGGSFALKYMHGITVLGD